MGNGIRKLGGDEITKYYTIKEKLGSGSFATVKHAVRKSDGKEFAIKIIKKAKLDQEELAIVHDEVEIMYKIDHPHCVKLYEMYETNKKLYMVMELLTGGELFDSIVDKGSYSEREASALIRDLAGAIKYLHSIGIVHRDLKPENLIYKDNTSSAPVKITDFGLAKFRGSSESMTTACGTPGYVAPEVLRRKGYGTPVDMWSLGVILYILLCGFPPFYHESTSALYKQIRAGEYDFPDPYWTDISAEAKDLVRSLLDVNPKTRFTAAQVLKHPWVRDKKAPSRKFNKSHNQRLKMLQARRKLRRGIQMVVAVNKFYLLSKREKAARAAKSSKSSGKSKGSSSSGGHSSSSKSKSGGKSSKHKSSSSSSSRKDKHKSSSSSSSKRK